MPPDFPNPFSAVKGDMETATLQVLSAGSLHFQQAELIAGEGRRDLHHAGSGGCSDERHDIVIIHVPGSGRMQFEIELPPSMDVCFLRGAGVEAGPCLDFTCGERV
jgi:hypothetical protein